MKKLLTLSLAQAPALAQTLGTFKGFTLEVCRNEASLNRAFALRYRAYLEVGSIEENEQKLLYDEYDFLPNARVFLVWYEGKAVATVRSCVYSDAYRWLPTEALTYFPTDITSELGAKTRYLESNRFAVDPDFQGRQSLYARFLLFRAHGLNAGVHDCGYIMTSVRSNHVAFYQRFLGLNPISSGEARVEWAHADVALLANETEECFQAILKKGMPAYDQTDIANYAVTAGIPQVLSQRLAA